MSDVVNQYGVGEEHFTQAGDERTEVTSDNNSLPPGAGRWSIPHILTFSQLVNAAIRTYKWDFDEALRHSIENAHAMRRDPIIFASLRARQIPVTQLAWKLELPIDEKHIAFKELSYYTSIAEEAVKSIRGWNKFLLCLQEALWYGKAAVHVQYEWRIIKGHKVLCVKRWYPIHGDKIRYKWDGTVGIQAFPSGAIPTEPSDRWTVHWLTPQERDQFIIHNYEPEDPDFMDGWLAGSIFGVGLRGRLYWLWYLKSLVMSYLIAYLERVGLGGLTVFFYEADNQRSFEEVSRLVAQQLNQHVILLPRNRDGSQGGPGVMRIENTGTAISMFQDLVNGYFDTLIQQLILGQTLTYSTGSATRGVAALHEDTFYRLVKHDALSLQDAITQDLISVIFKYSFPSVSQSLYPSFKFIIDPPNAPQLLNYAVALTQLGIPVDEQQLRDITGLKAPRHGEDIANVNMAPYMPSESSIPFINEILKRRATNERVESTNGKPEQGTEEPIRR